MARNNAFRIYPDEEVMLKVYGRRLKLADIDFDKREPTLRTFIERYENDVNEDQVTDEGHRVNVTHGIGIIDTMFSSMTAVEVEFLCKNAGNGTELQAIAATKGLNQAWKDTKGRRRAKKAIKDALLADIGWVKVYYDYVEDVETRDRPEAAVRAEIQELLGEDPSLSDEDIGKMVKMTDDVAVVLRDRVCVDYVPWDMIRYDISAKQSEDIRWVAQYTRMPVPEVTKNPQYRAFIEDRYGVEDGRRRLEAIEGDATVTSGRGLEYEELREQDDFEDDRRVTVVEMWDLETGLTTVFPKNAIDLVLHQRVNPLMFNVDIEDRSPFKPLVVRDDPENVEGLGDMRVIHPSLKELDEYRSNIAEHVARSIPKYFGPEDALKEVGKKAIESREWGVYVPLSGGRSFQDIGTPQIPVLTQEVYDIPDKILDEMKEATGANEVLRGVFPSRRTTATETELVTTAGQNRQGERRSAMEDWYLDIAKTMLQLMQLFYDRERILRYTNDLGETFTWEWTLEDIAVDADIQVAITPRENPTRQERFQRAVFVMNLALPLPETDRASLMQFVYREMGLDEDLIRTLVKPQDEVDLEQQKATLLAASPQAGAPGLRIGAFSRGRGG